MRCVIESTLTLSFYLSCLSGHDSTTPSMTLATTSVWTTNSSSDNNSPYPSRGPRHTLACTAMVSLDGRLGNSCAQSPSQPSLETGMRWKRICGPVDRQWLAKPLRTPVLRMLSINDPIVPFKSIDRYVAFREFVESDCRRRRLESRVIIGF
jgi:hypothetical protein